MQFSLNNLFVISSLPKTTQRFLTGLKSESTPVFFQNLREISLPQSEKPLLRPTTCLIYDASVDTQKSFLETLTSLKTTLVNYKAVFVLYIVTENQMPTIEKYLRYSDEFALDYVTPRTIATIVKQGITRIEREKKLVRDLNEASDIALLSMAHSSELGEISRFILSSYNCSEYDELIDLLLETLPLFNVSCSVLIVVDDWVLCRLAENQKEEIRTTLLQRHDRSRLHYIGSDVIISFPQATLMMHGLPIDDDASYGRLVDNLTVLANCFAARAKGIHAESQASAASRAKTMFLAMMSHELRTPMNSVIGFTELLIKRLDDRLNEKEKRHLNAIKRNSDHLLALINDILDMSKIEVGKMEIFPERVNTQDTLETIFTQLSPIAEKKGLAFELNIEIQARIIHADLKRFTQMVMNLISNAIKYTETGKVSVSLDESRVESIGDSLCLSVTDTGIGISNEDQCKLFNSFVQIDTNLSRKTQGSGLGLAITKVFADMHGGTITLQSEINKGSCFRLYLPLPSNPRSPDIIECTLQRASEQTSLSEPRKTQNIEFF